MVFPVVVYGCESWTIKKAECQRINAFELWCWGRLNLPINCGTPVSLKGNQSWIFMKGLMLKLKFQYYGHLMWRADSLEKTRMLENIEGRMRRDDRGWDGWMASLIQWTWVWVSSGSWWWTGKPGILQSTGLQRVKHNWATELNWTEISLWPLQKKKKQ